VELYHVINRGVDGRDLFLDDRDYLRFVHNLQEFNDHRPAEHIRSRSADFVNPRSEKERIVQIHGWCLMKNHYHLLLSEYIPGGLTLFIRKLNVGYANYFNERYVRKGALFQGRTKKVRIERDAHFLYVLHYIHLNPLDGLAGAKDWRVRNKNEITNSAITLRYLDAYRWSSYADYCGTPSFPYLLTTDLFLETFVDYRKAITLYLRDREVTGPLKLALE
jgi:putative transposase